MSCVRFSPLTETFGVQAHGVDLSAIPDTEVMRALGFACAEHKVVLLRGQNLSLEAYARFAHEWGEPRDDAFTDLSVPGFPDLSRVGNTGGLLEEEMHRNGSCFWHTDCTTEQRLDATTILYCVHAPASGGETHIADLQRAYEALDELLQVRIENLSARHSYAGTQPNIDGREASESALAPYADTSVSKLPQGKVRPLVWGHSFTGRKGLYAPAGSIVSIDGMRQAEAGRLVRQLKLHAVADKFCYHHKYQPGDVLMWDNSATSHCATAVRRAVSETDKRLLYRIVRMGLPKALAR